MVTARYTTSASAPCLLDEGLNPIRHGRAADRAWVAVRDGAGATRAEAHVATGEEDDALGDVEAQRAEGGVLELVLVGLEGVGADALVVRLFLDLVELGEGAAAAAAAAAA